MGILRYTDGKPDTVTGILNTVENNCKEEIPEFFYAKRKILLGYCRCQKKEILLVVQNYSWVYLHILKERTCLVSHVLKQELVWSHMC